METLAFIPSPSAGEIHLGPLPLRGYALCIILGVFVAVWLGGRRWIARGGRAGTVADIAVWAVPFGLIGGRLYHVITDYQLYFGEGRNWVDAFRIWDGGLGIWGAIALGAVGAWVGCRRRGIPLPAYADAVAPGIALAQALGRWGNWFNQELYGRATDLPWALKIDPEHRPVDTPDLATYHPTFLYESLWCVGVAILVIWADRRFKLGHGRTFALYVAAYTVGRFWIEYMRVDDAHHVFGMRLNNWTAIVVFLAAVAAIVISAKKHPGREEVVEPAEEESEEPGKGAAADKSSGPKKAAAGSKKGADEPKKAAVSGKSPEPEPEAAAGSAGKSSGAGESAESGKSSGAAADAGEEPAGGPADDASASGSKAVDGSKS
ncbi:prolipoprotein diacylglyceryl transferase [Streptomyces iconiensis]|uniref:Phosphatidylglycerol--prolipoprotein diacylglyceryl transferase n=1 Tax=Streptomyces iconiensis TaxID=1384038 RepID=A0ABT6ZXS3_9ACTN|nr:prolipoprotein diacylglyceryl transferase [Streptomyces iconiensis]MDJ1133860.1 prolipoprotein diacylglyceryl transferase [Streptomyces iconiensis]